MARRKNYFNFNDFNFVDGATELFNNTIRGAFQFDAYTGDVFEARVLVSPQPYADTSQEYFIVRIIGDLSPHRFLQDPCTLSTPTTDEEKTKVFNLIQNHTKVFCTAGEGPEEGDVVRIRLEANEFSFRTDTASEYLGISKTSDNAGSAGAPAACSIDLAGAFTAGIKLGAVMSLGMHGLSYEKHFDPSIPPIADPLTKGDAPRAGNFYQDRGGHKHQGIDPGASEGTPIYAPHAGTVYIKVSKCVDQWNNLEKDATTGKFIAKFKKDCGRQPPGNPEGPYSGNYMILVDSTETFYTGYMHLHPPLSSSSGAITDALYGMAVADGTVVSKGTLIGRTGNTGNSTGAHLHFEIHKTAPGRGRDSSGQVLNPSWYIGSSAHAAAAAERVKELGTAAVGSTATPSTTATAHGPAPGGSAPTSAGAGKPPSP